ncbi:MAG: integrase [Nitrospiraceae bacterium]|nr:integrase [Nitrospiraceae bacterium]
MAKGIYKRGRIWWITYIGLDGKQYFESSKSDLKADAEYKLACKRKDIGEGKEPVTRKIQKYTFQELWEKYKEWAVKQKSYRSKKLYINQIGPVFNSVPIRNFNTWMVEQFQSQEYNKGKKPATVNRYLQLIKHMFTKAVEWEMVEEDVLKKVRKVKLLPENNRRLRFLSKEECRALISSCDSHLKPIVVTALNTGCRKGEVLSLEWEKHVDLRHGFITLDKTKNGDRREIPINDTLRGALQGLTRRLDVPYVFFDAVSGKPFRDVKRSFGTALKRVDTHKCPDCSCQKVKVRIKEAPIEKCPQCGANMAVVKGIQDFHFHDLRHTFASHLVMAGVDLTTVSRLLGHKTLTMTLRYAHLAPSHMAKAVDILDKQLGEVTLHLHDNLRKEA